jgi:hypothetical protein
MEWVRSTGFASQQPARIYNASGVVPVGPARFVFIDNQDPTSLFELNLNPDGTQNGLLVPRPITGVAAGALSDPEGIARIDVDGAIDLIVASSLSVRRIDISGNAIAHDGLVRIRYAADGDLSAQSIPGFRKWLLDNNPELAEAAVKIPNDGGLNIEGLAWDPARGALLFGIRSPVTQGKISVLSVQVDVDGPWGLQSLRAGPTLTIEKSDFPAPQGIRDLDYDASRQEFLVLLGRSVSLGAAPFQLCSWDGSATTVDVLDATFVPPMKPEGVTAIPGADPRTLLIVDDASGFALAMD